MRRDMVREIKRILAKYSLSLPRMNLFSEGEECRHETRHLCNVLEGIYTLIVTAQVIIEITAVLLFLLCIIIYYPYLTIIESLNGILLLF